MRRVTTLVAGVALALAGCTTAPTPTTPPAAPSPSDVRPVPSPTVARTDPPATSTLDAVVYFPRESSGGVRLGRELHPVAQGDPLRGALEAMLAGPDDPDYSNGWAPGTRVLSATTSGSVTTVDLSSEARTTSLAPEAAHAQADQLVWTVTELVGADTTVRLTVDGQPAGDLWGAGSWAEPRARADVFSTRVLVSIDTPSEGSTVRSPLVVTGDAAAHEARLLWRVLDAGGAVVQQGATTTAEGMVFAPYRIEVALPPGRYTVEVAEEDLGSGEGRAPDTDTRAVTIEG